MDTIFIVWLLMIVYFVIDARLRRGANAKSYEAGEFDQKTSYHLAITHGAVILTILLSPILNNYLGNDGARSILYPHFTNNIGSTDCPRRALSPDPASGLSGKSPILDRCRAGNGELARRSRHHAGVHLSLSIPHSGRRNHAACDLWTGIQRLQPANVEVNPFPILRIASNTWPATLS